ncbi:hypothetical protein ACL02O_18685 [Micromonospora sp. MS34]|uniref:hypothetical protein n=1 Tax=Micromonospora sp. MS34 TaxID=3385971 RepID=UPI0039A34151
MSPPARERVRHALVGAGARAEMFVRALALDHADTADPFALRLADHPRLRELYLDAEAEDGYQRDRNVFAPGVAIEDDLAVLAPTPPARR